MKIFTKVLGIASLSVLALFNDATCSEQDGTHNFSFFAQYNMTNSDANYVQNMTQAMAQILNAFGGQQNNMHHNASMRGQQHQSNNRGRFQEGVTVQTHMTISDNLNAFGRTLSIYDNLYRSSLSNINSAPNTFFNNIPFFFSSQNKSGKK